MYRGSGGYQRGGGRGRGAYSGGMGRGGFSGGRDNRAYSSSSGSSSGQSNRPVLRPAAATRGRVTPPKQASPGPARVDSPMTPVREQSSYTLNGHTISETYTPSGSGSNVATTPPRSYNAPTSPTPTRGTYSRTPSRGSYSPTPNRGNYGGNTPGRQSAMHRPTTRNGAVNWAALQEYKIKILGMPKSYWTKAVHKAMSQYGTVVRIEMSKGSLDSSAWVTFQPPPRQALPQRLNVGQATVRWEEPSPRLFTVPSPVDPSRHYQERNILFANSVDFGIQDAEMSLIKMRSIQPDAPGRVQLMLNLDRKELDIQFPLKIGDEMRKFRFRLPIALLSRIYKDTNCSLKQTALIIPFGSAPQFFVQKFEDEQLIDGRTHTSFSTKESTWIEWNTWFRETDVVDVGVKESLRVMPLMAPKNTAIIDIGRWTSYRLLLDDIVLAKPQFREFASALADHGVEIEDCHDYTVKDRIDSPLWTLLEEEISGTHPDLESSAVSSDLHGLSDSRAILEFPVRYQFEACLSNGYLKEHTITTEFLEKLKSLDQRRAVYILEKVVDKQQVYYDPMDIFKIRIKCSLDKKVPSYCILQRFAVITPTSIHVASPVMETSNRITRKYAADADRFIRIKFSDEKTEGVLRNMPNDRAEAPFDRVRRAMRNGIVVAGRFYEFLAFGNSQFREHGAYFYAPTSSKSADDIRLSLGQFDHIKTVAKFGARLGQCFSTTRAMRINVKIVKIPDIERNGYCFTDGVGKLSPFLAQMAAQELGLANAFNDPPSLYQFRLGGCKGVLALDPKITGSEVHIRPSQKKFEAEYTGLEIIRSSALATPFFNRQIIIVLSNLGVPDSVFIRKQQEMVNDYEMAMTDNGIAINKLRKHIDMNQTTLTMAGMVLDGFMKTREPFMMSLLKLWRASTIKNLKEKARIAVEDGAFVLGCVDETATLKGHMDDPQSRMGATRQEKLKSLPEIFLQVDDTKSNKKGHYKIVEGICVLARNPSLHPGDLRIVRAVNVKELHHLKNVVVMPQTGDRDLANMCSGGDLDGDDYMVLWDENLVPDLINVPPMNFTPETPIEKEEPITVSDISDFFVTYMQNDTLGQIAHAHLAQADLHGVQGEACLALAELHSKAVDYPKSGIPATMTRELRPWKWPHFMEKKHLPENRIYKSKNVLGQLYNQVQLVDFKPQYTNFDKRILDAFELDDSLLQAASEIKVAYDEPLRRLMAKHGIRTEFEAWSVFVLGHNHETGDYKFAEEFGRNIGALKSQFRETCRLAANGSDAQTPADSLLVDWNRLAPFVAAMYTVTAREVEAAIKQHDSEHMPLMSFPWLFTSELGKIATQQSVRQLEPLHNQEQKQKTHKKKKYGDDIKDPAAVGTVETEGRILHVGDVLNLNFEEQPREQDKEEQKSSEVEAKEEQKNSGFDGVAEQSRELEVRIDNEESALARLVRLGSGGA